MAKGFDLRAVVLAAEDMIIFAFRFGEKAKELERMREIERTNKRKFCIISYVGLLYRLL
jgi:hypothetical protein